MVMISVLKLGRRYNPNYSFQESDFQSTMEMILAAKTLTKENRSFWKQFVESVSVYVPKLFDSLCDFIVASRTGIWHDELRESLIGSITNIAIHNNIVKMMVINKFYRIERIAEAMHVRGYTDSDNTCHNHKDIVRSRQNQGMSLLRGLCIPIQNMRHRVPHGHVGDNR